METHFKLLKVDETRDWSEDITSQVDKLYGIYLIDTNSHTYCCELTPSYAAYFLYTTFDDSNLSDDDFEVVNEMIYYADVYTPSVSYFHVGDTKKFAHDFGKENHTEIVEDMIEIIEDMIEHCKGNHYV